MPILSASGGASAKAYGWGALSKISTAYESIATTTLGAAASTLSFSSIPSTFKHLQIRINFDVVTSGSEIRLRLNSDSGTNYAYHYILGNGTSVVAGGATTQTFCEVISASSNTYPTVAIIDILDYASTTKNKVVRVLAGNDRNGSGEIWVTSSLWLNTSAINALTFSLDSGNIDTGSTAALYGIKESA